MLIYSIPILTAFVFTHSGPKGVSHENLLLARPFVDGRQRDLYAPENPPRPE